MQDGVNNNDNNSQQDEDLQQSPQLLSQEEANEKYRAQQHVNRDLERKLKEALKQNDKYKSMEEEYAK